MKPLAWVYRGYPADGLATVRGQDAGKLCRSIEPAAGTPLAWRTRYLRGVGCVVPAAVIPDLEAAAQVWGRFVVVTANPPVSRGTCPRGHVGGQSPGVSPQGSPRGQIPGQEALL